MGAGGLGTRRTSLERLSAWLLTGPLGHLYAFLADVVALWARWAVPEVRRLAVRARARARSSPGPGRCS